MKNEWSIPLATVVVLNILIWISVLSNANKLSITHICAICFFVLLLYLVGFVIEQNRIRKKKRHQMKRHATQTVKIYDDRRF